MVAVTLDRLCDHLHQKKPGARVKEESPLGLLSTWFPAVIFNFHSPPPPSSTSKIAKNSACFGHSCFLSFGKISDLACLLDEMKILRGVSKKDILQQHTNVPQFTAAEFTVGSMYMGTLHAAPKTCLSVVEASDSSP